MKKYMKKLIMIIFATVIALPMITVSADAASAVSISGGDNVSGGEVFTISVTFNGDSIGRVVGDITYDTEMLSYVSGGSSSGNVGYVELKKAGTGEPLSFDLKFQALKTGSTSVTVSTSEMYDLGEMFLDTPSASKTVNISGDAADEEIIQETNPEDNAADEGLSVDEKGDTPAEEPVDEDALNPDEAGDNNSTFLGKAIMFGVIGLVLILIIAMIIRRKK